MYNVIIKQLFPQISKMKLQIQALVDDAHCYDVVRKMRWPDGVKCPHCESGYVIKRGHDEGRNSSCQRYECKECRRRFDDLTNTVFSGHHQPLKVWIIFSYFMGLNLSTQQIAQELCLNGSDAQHMAEVLRTKIVENKPKVELSREVECDEVYVVAGHKGQPEAVKKRIVKEDAID
jgi:transposase-like protein